MRLPEDRAVDEIYQTKKSFPILIVALVCLSFFLAFLFNFPLGKNIKTYAQKAISKNRSCPLSYDDLEIGFFLPKLIFKNLIVPGRCFNQRGKSLQLSHAQIKLSMPSLWPLGIKTKLEAKGKGIQINAFPRISISGTDIQIEDSFIEGSFLSQFTPVKLQGRIKIQGTGKLSGNKIVKGSIKASSKNIFVPAQQIMAFNLSALPIKKLELAGTYVNKSFNIKAFRLGDSAAPVHTEFKGTLKPNNRNMKLSTLSLDGRFKLSDSVLNEISLLRLLLNGKPNKRGYYFVKLDGTLGLPKPTFVDPS